MADKEYRFPGYAAILPPRVRYDKDVPVTAKLLYAEVTAMTDVTGFCWATNGYLGHLVGVSKDRAARLLGILEEKGYVEIQVIRDEKNAVTERRVYVTDLGLVKLPPPVKNTGRGPGENTGSPPGENTGKNDKSIDLPPYSPPRGTKRAQEHKDAPDWKPDRFLGLWVWYPHDKRGNKQRAIRAWEQLHPDDALIDTIAMALNRQSKTGRWKDGVGIPNLSTYLNGYGWEGWDEPDDKPAGPREVPVWD